MSRKHVPYGMFKRGSGKLHPHNECAICDEKNISKKKARRKAKEEMKETLKEGE